MQQIFSTIYGVVYNITLLMFTHNCSTTWCRTLVIVGILSQLVFLQLWEVSTMLACVLYMLYTHALATHAQVPLLQCFQDIAHGPLVPWESKQNTRSVQKKTMNVTPGIYNRPISTHLQPIGCSLLPAVIASNHFKGLIKMNVAVCRYQLRVGARHQLTYAILTMALKERWIHKTVLTQPASYLQIL